MAKIKTVYVCQNCGHQVPKWTGKCEECEEWNTFEEEMLEDNKARVPGSENQKKVASKPYLIKYIPFKEEIRIDTLNSEFNRVLGGGLVLGSLTLLGGEPGIGKSTLALQIALCLQKLKVLYISGEESLQQIKLRAERIYKGENNNCYLLSETRLEYILKQIDALRPDMIVIDSIQTISSNKSESIPGSITQIRICAVDILTYAKENNVPVILIGHINKDGHLAGPKVLEHIVDTVLQFEGDGNHLYRIVRAAKNRFGSISEIGVFEMKQNGLHPVGNLSESLISSENTNSGVAVSANMEGIRPFLIEVQSLVSTAAYGTPQRNATGFNIKRLNMILAVLEKRAGFKLSGKDVFLNIAGGLRVEDTATDLAIACAILSSDINISLPKQVVCSGEIGLSGEIRPVIRIEQRISEAEKLGFKKIYISSYNYRNLSKKKYKIDLFPVTKIEEVFKDIFK